MLKYRYRIVCIKLDMHYKLKRLWLAGKLLKLTNKLAPELMNQYDAAIISKFLRDGKVGIKW